MTGPTTVSAEVHVFRQHDDRSLHERPHESCVCDEGVGGDDDDDDCKADSSR